MLGRAGSQRKERFFAHHEPSCSDGVSFTEANGFLPEGISRAGELAICATRFEPDLKRAVELARGGGGPVQVAVFDFDGTCIGTSSSRRLVTNLWRRSLISNYKALRAAFWGFAYKLNLPRDEQAVRRRVFSAFKGRSAPATNRYMASLYEDEMEPRFLADADAELAAHVEEGHVVVIASATFEPMLAAAMLRHPMQFSISTRMEVDASGCYTDRTVGMPANGSDKVVVLREFLNGMFGDGGWEIGFAYGDHFSDIPFLEQATHPCAVNPDQRLRRYAESKGWDIREWE